MRFIRALGEISDSLANGVAVRCVVSRYDAGRGRGAGRALAGSGAGALGRGGGLAFGRCLAKKASASAIASAVAKRSAALRAMARATVAASSGGISGTNVSSGTAGSLQILITRS